MEKIFNSPIFITVLVLCSLFGYHQYNKNMAASEIRAVYEELILISEDAKDDLEKKKIIKGFISEGISQVKEAFSEASATSSSNDGKPSHEDKEKAKNKNYFETKLKISFTDPAFVENTEYSNVKKSYVYELTNNSDQYVGNLKHTITFYQGGKITKSKEEWGHIKLAPGESKVYSNSLSDDLTFDEIKISLNDLNILKMPEK